MKKNNLNHPSGMDMMTLEDVYCNRVEGRFRDDEPRRWSGLI